MAGNMLLNVSLVSETSKGYSEVMTPQVVRFMKANGLLQRNAEARSVGQGWKGPRVIRSDSGIQRATWRGWETTASQRAKTKEIDPDREKLNKEREEVKTEKGKNLLRKYQQSFDDT